MKNVLGMEPLHSSVIKPGGAIHRLVLTRWEANKPGGNVNPYMIAHATDRTGRRVFTPYQCVNVSVVREKVSAWLKQLPKAVVVIYQLRSSRPKGLREVTSKVWFTF